MNYATIKKHDIANGLGVRVSLFVSGCTHHCKGCFNPETWDFNHGNPFTEDTMKDVLDACNHTYVSGLSLLGGEPLEPGNRAALIPLIKEFKEHFPDKSIWCYSGYLYEQLIDAADAREFLTYIDVLVDGEFQLDNKDIRLAFRGSSNQRIIDIKRSLSAGHVVVYQFN